VYITTVESFQKLFLVQFPSLNSRLYTLKFKSGGFNKANIVLCGIGTGHHNTIHNVFNINRKDNRNSIEKRKL